MLRKAFFFLTAVLLVFSCDNSYLCGKSVETQNLELDDSFSLEGSPETLFSTTRGMELKPFPQGENFPGIIKPNKTQSELDQNLVAFYRRWANADGQDKGYFMNNLNVGGTDYYYVHADFTGVVPETWGSVLPCTQSEAHGFGMVIAVLMAGSTYYGADIVDEKAIFDSMFSVSRKFLWKNTNLMWWILPENGNNSQSWEDDPATDGDVNMAYALILADRQWGSDGAINYLAEAKKIIVDIKTFETTSSFPRPNMGDPNYPKNLSRPSDWMIDTYLSFYSVTGDTYWHALATELAREIDEFQRLHSPGTGLISDFVFNDPGTPVKPAPEGSTDEGNEDDYYYNSCRVPFRLARTVSHYPDFGYGGTTIRAMLNKINTWFQNKYPSPTRPGIKAGYYLNGDSMKTYEDNCFTSPFAAGQIVSGNQNYITAMYNIIYDWFEGYGPHEPGTSDEWFGYYGDTITLLSQLVISGNWWNPCSQAQPKKLSSLKPVYISEAQIYPQPPYDIKTNVNDDNQATVLGFQATYQPYVCIDLGGNHKLTKLVIYWYNPYYSKQYYIGAKVAGAWQKTTVTSDGNIDQYDLAAYNITTNMVGVQILTGPEHPLYGIREIEVWGY